MKKALPLIIAAASVLAVPLPAAAYFAYRGDGTRGPVSFHDSATDVAYECLYRTKRTFEDGSRRVRLRRMVVRAPIMRAITDGQTLGWQVFVVRHGDDDYNTGFAGWKDVYKSEIQTAAGSTTADADFTPVSVPAPIPPDTSDHFGFMIRIKVFWYKPETTLVQGWSKYVVSYSNWKLDGDYVSWRMGWGPACVGRQTWGPEPVPSGA